MNDESEASVDYWTGKDIYAIYKFFLSGVKSR